MGALQHRVPGLVVPMLASSGAHLDRRGGMAGGSWVTAGEAFGYACRPAALPDAHQHPGTRMHPHTHPQKRWPDASCTTVALQHLAAQSATLAHFWPWGRHASVVMTTAGVLAGPKMALPSGAV